ACLRRAGPPPWLARACRLALAAGAAGVGAFVAGAGGVEAVRTPAGYLDTPWGVLLFSALSLAFFGLVGFVTCLDDRVRAGTRPPVPLRLLEWRPVRGLGRISYGVYLYHPIVFSYGRAYADRLLA